MLEPVNEIINILNKETIVFNFTPKNSNSDYKRRNRFNYVWHSRGNEYAQVGYGYYEIKDSSLGPVMILLDDESVVYGKFKEIITVKVPAIKWVVSVREGSPGFFRALDFICRMPKNETGFSAETAKSLYDTYLDIPLPKAYRKVKAPNLCADSGGLSLEVFDALSKAGEKHRPFDLSDFPGVSLKPNYDPYIPYFLIALLMGANFAGAPAKINTAAPNAKQVMATTHRQSQANYINYLTALQKVKGC